MKISVIDFFSKCEDMFILVKEIPNGKLHFLRIMRLLETARKSPYLTNLIINI